MTLPSPPTERKTALRRLRTVLREQDRLLHDLEEVGDVSVFGGAVRDLFRIVPSKFESDVDLVVDGHPDALAALCSLYRAPKNRFGGYRIQTSSSTRPIDVWALENTWAFKAALLPAKNLQELCRTTYFSTDSILYNLTTGRLHHPADYFTNLDKARVDLVLPENPNPVGAFWRTLKFSFIHRFSLSRKLTEHTAFLWDKFSHKERLELDARTQQQRIGDLHDFLRSIDKYLSAETSGDFKREGPLSKPRSQLHLGF